MTDEIGKIEQELIFLKTRIRTLEDIAVNKNAKMVARKFFISSLLSIIAIGISVVAILMRVYAK
jgi:hypothetical protein